MPREKKLRQILKQRPLRSIIIKQKIYKALSVAGSDPSGGAGIQGDLKTFSAFDVYGCAVITAITAQNTSAVNKIYAIPTEIIKSQIESVVDDLGPLPLKIGMVVNIDSYKIIIDLIRKYNLKNVVVDPVMLSTSGTMLTDENTIDVMRELIKKALLVTPNMYEAARLTEKKVRSLEDMKEAALALYQEGAKNVLIKGGHLEKEATDLFFDGNEFILLKEKRLREEEVRGTGCALSASIVAGLSRGMPLMDSVVNGKIFVTRALKYAIEVGKGAMVLNFFA